MSTQVPEMLCVIHPLYIDLDIYIYRKVIVAYLVRHLWMSISDLKPNSSNHILMVMLLCLKDSYWSFYTDDVINKSKARHTVRRHTQCAKIRDYLYNMFRVRGQINYCLQTYSQNFILNKMQLSSPT